MGQSADEFVTRVLTDEFVTRALGISAEETVEKDTKSVGTKEKINKLDFMLKKTIFSLNFTNHSENGYQESTSKA